MVLCAQNQALSGDSFIKNQSVLATIAARHFRWLHDFFNLLYPQALPGLW